MIVSCCTYPFPLLLEIPLSLIYLYDILTPGLGKHMSLPTIFSLIRSPASLQMQRNCLTHQRPRNNTNSEKGDLKLTHWGQRWPYGAAVPGQPSLASPCGDPCSQRISGKRNHMTTKILELHTATYPQISYIHSYLLTSQKSALFLFYYPIKMKLASEVG